MSETPLWAAYLEMTYDTGENRARHQWILMPPLRQAVIDSFRLGGVRETVSPSFFHRKQDSPTHRSVWRTTHLTLIHSQGDLLDEIDQLHARGWAAKPMVTCEIHPQEMRDIVADGWKTPYRIISRLTRVAQAVHNYTI